MELLLAVDVGNTNITVGCLDEGGKPVFEARFSTDWNKTRDEYAVLFKNTFSIYGTPVGDIVGGIISSVVPPLTDPLKDAIELIIGKQPMVVGPGLKTGLNILLDNPSQLGADLVAGAVASTAFYPVPQIIVDMGTATTISVIESKGGFIGGIILPGLRASQEALTSRTSQLPRISLDTPKRVIGRGTIECMQSGAIYGAAAMVEGLCDRIEKEVGEACTVVATGGLAGRVVPHCRREIIVDENLLLKGLFILYTKNVYPKWGENLLK